MSTILSLHVHAQGHYVLVHIGGELDIATASDTRDFLLSAVAECGNLVVDVTEVTFADATGINALLAASRHAVRSGGWLRLVGPCPQMRRVLQILRISMLLPTYDTACAACADTVDTTPG